MRTFTAAVGLALALLSSLSASAAGPRPVVTRKAPYLTYAGDNNEMEIHWQLHSTEVCTLDWGSDTSYGDGTDITVEYGDDHQHTYTLGRLMPGQLYHYRVTAGPEVHTGSFRTAPQEEATDVCFLAYGDTRTYPADHDVVAAAMVSTYASEPEYQTFTLVAGDLVGDGDLESHWDAQFFDPAYAGIQALLRHAPYLSVMGNHEGDGVLYQKYFPYPFVGGRYWSFDYGPVHVVMVDQYTSYSTGSAQLAWIESDLAGTDRPWRFLCLHEPGWSSGGGHSNEIPVQLYLQPLCERYGVSIVFGGHNHYYARAVVNDVQHITTGGGGAPLRTPDTGYPFVVTTAEAHHFCKVSIEGSELEFVAVTPAGAVLDSFSAGAWVGVEGVAPRGPELLPCFPNPFNPQTTVAFTVPDGVERATITVHDAAGRLVRTLLDGELPSERVREAARGGGRARAVAWDGADDRGQELPSGVYLVKLSADGESAFRKITLLK